MSLSFAIGAIFLMFQTPIESAVAEDEIELTEVERDFKGYTFAERQLQLVEMARLLGRMHHLHKTCQPNDYLPNRFRDRMKELVTLEEPPETVRGDMVSAFNQGFQTAKTEVLECTPDILEKMRALATEGRVLTGQLASPLRTGEGSDYYAVEERPAVQE